VVVLSSIGILFLPFRRYFPVISGTLFCIISCYWGLLFSCLFTEEPGGCEFDDPEELLGLWIYLCACSIFFMIITFVMRSLKHRKITKGVS
jgi:hypothetical protein